MALQKFPEADLTENAVEDITSGLHVSQPVFQVLGSCYCDSMCSGPIYSCVQRSVRLSDGDKYFDAYLVSKHEDANDHQVFQKHAIVQLVDFNTEHVLCGKYTVLIFEGILLHDGENLGVLGNPTSLRPQKDPKWYTEVDDEDGFYSRLDEVVTLLLRYRDKEIDQVEYHKQALTATFCNPRLTAKQRQHIKEGVDALDESRDQFLMASYNPTERLTPYMSTVPMVLQYTELSLQGIGQHAKCNNALNVMHIEEGRNYISPTVIETAFREEIWRNPQFIQVVSKLHLEKCERHQQEARRGRKSQVRNTLEESKARNDVGMANLRVARPICGHGARYTRKSEGMLRAIYCFPADEADGTLQSLTKFAELMEREGVLAYGTRFDKRTEKPKPFKVKKVKQSAANSLPQPEKVISVGAVETLAHGGEFKNPILQVLLFKKILHVGEDTYAILLSDGYDIMTGFLDKGIFKETPKSCFLPFTMVQILKYSFIKVLSYRNTLLIQKIGYHIPPTANQKSPIGRPLYYTYNVEPTPEEVEKLPTFCPRQTIEIIAAQRLYKQEMKRHNLMLNMSAKRASLARNAAADSESKALEESDQSDHSASTELISITDSSYVPIERALAMDGFCKYADLWHEKATRTTRLPDGRLIVRRPVTQRVPYHFSVTRDMSTKLRNKIIVKR
ncbi:hypothetical protein HOLleu_09979 [Holothuria leucospilota]|uniref:Uncharacterized protein n=1 Tax=Holothuria leucospilota TaxID=206669 RepID=A0A9Q1HFD2_HOLLE|nr:hypothetical protein HOLleu_09979 [Holothuria leucospilota]